MDKKPEIQKHLILIVVATVAIIELVIGIVTLKQTNIIVAIGMSVAAGLIWMKSRKSE